MIINRDTIDLHYEPIRLSRYGNIPQHTAYSSQEAAIAYFNWSTCYSGYRENLWDIYCDIRDMVPAGTNAKIRKVRREMH